MTPREYMRACGVPDDVEVATAFSKDGHMALLMNGYVAADAAVGASVYLHAVVTPLDTEESDVPDALITSNARLCTVDYDDAIAWIARKP